MKYFTKINDKLHLAIVTQDRQYPIFKINGDIDSYDKLTNLTDGDEDVDTERLLERLSDNIRRFARNANKIEEYKQYYNSHKKNGFAEFLDGSHLMVFNNQFRHRLGIIPVNIPGAICIDNTDIFDIVIDPPEVPPKPKAAHINAPVWNDMIRNYNRIFINPRDVDINGINPENIEENHEN